MNVEKVVVSRMTPVELIFQRKIKSVFDKLKKMKPKTMVIYFSDPEKNTFSCIRK